MYNLHRRDKIIKFVEIFHVSFDFRNGEKSHLIRVSIGAYEALKGHYTACCRTVHMFDTDTRWTHSRICDILLKCSTKKILNTN